MQLFTYVVSHKPAKKGKTEVEYTIIGSGLTYAKDQKTLSMKLARALPKKWDKNLDEVEILVQSYSAYVPSLGYLSINNGTNYATNTAAMNSIANTASNQFLASNAGTYTTTAAAIK